MDTSEQYIKMCQEAHEIQELRPVGKPWHDGDYTNDDIKTFYSSDVDYWYDDYKDAIDDRESYEIWLPRQDQLQEMLLKTGKYTLKDRDEPYPNYISSMLQDIESFEMNLYDNYNSFEQLWLAFVMKEKYSKHWNSESETWEQSK